MNKKQLIIALSWGWAIIVALFFIIKGVGLVRFVIPAFILVGNYVIIKVYWNKKK